MTTLQCQAEYISQLADAPRSQLTDEQTAWLADEQDVLSQFGQIGDADLSDKPSLYKGALAILSKAKQASARIRLSRSRDAAQPSVLCAIDQLTGSWEVHYNSAIWQHSFSHPTAYERARSQNLTLIISNR